MPKKRSISTSLLEEAAEKYIKNRKQYNIAKLSDQYDIPYSTLRRYLLNYIDRNSLTSNLVEDFLPYEGFEYLELGDTYQFAEHLTIWLIKGHRKLDGDRVFLLIPTNKKSERHWICDDLQSEEE